MKTTAEDMAWKHETMVRYFKTGRLAFYGETCGQCKAAANVANGPGWFCPCGAFNVQCWSGGPPMHDVPQYGPARHAIQAAQAAQQT